MIKNRSIYAREFNQTMVGWEDNREVNRIFLRAVQSYFNDVLMARGYVFLRDIYEKLGIPVTKESIIVGWHYDRKDHSAHNYIDFGLNDTEDGPNFVLDFNVDGDITRHF